MSHGAVTAVGAMQAAGPRLSAYSLRSTHPGLQQPAKQATRSPAAQLIRRLAYQRTTFPRSLVLDTTAYRAPSPTAVRGRLAATASKGVDGAGVNRIGNARPGVLGITSRLDPTGRICQSQGQEKGLPRIVAPPVMQEAGEATDSGYETRRPR